MSAPQWFREAVATLPVSAEVAGQEGGRLHYRLWGGGPGLIVLVHGRSAHSHWWDHIAPFLADNHRVVAVDLAGHGESGWRENYDLVSWARDVALVIQAERGRYAPIIIGHSMGATVALVLASLKLVPLACVVAIDSPIGVSQPRGARRTMTARKYSTRIEAESRFRVLPADPSTIDFIERYLASHSVRQLPGLAWTWKTDPLAMTPALVQPDEISPAVDVPLLLVLSERGLATWRASRQVAHRFRQSNEIVCIADAGHHIMADQPLTLISLLQRKLFAA